MNGIVMLLIPIFMSAIISTEQVQFLPPSLEPPVECGGPPPCVTPNCIHTSSNILARIDSTVDPCEDFFKFSCGQWQEANKHKINDQDFFYAANLNEMPEELDETLLGLLDRTLTVEKEFYGSKPYMDLFHFYESCLDVEKIQKQKFQPAADFLSSLKEFYTNRPFDKNEFNLTKAVIELLKVNGVPLFDVTLDTSIHNASTWAFVISTPRHYGLVPELIGPKNTKWRKRGVRKFRNKKSLKMLKKIIKEVGEHLFFKDLFANELKRPMNKKHKFKNGKKKYSFYSNLDENESPNVIKDSEKNEYFDKNSNYFDSSDILGTSFYPPNVISPKPAFSTADLGESDNYFPFDDSANVFGDTIITDPVKFDDNFKTTPTVPEMNSPTISTEDLPLFSPEVLEMLTPEDHPPVISPTPEEPSTVTTGDLFLQEIPPYFGFSPGGAEEEAEFSPGDILAMILELLQTGELDASSIIAVPPYVLIRGEIYHDNGTLVDSSFATGEGVAYESSAVSRVELLDNLYTNIRNEELSDIVQMLSREEVKQALGLDDSQQNKNIISQEWENRSNSSFEEYFQLQIVTFIEELNKLEPAEREEIYMIQHGQIFNSYTINELQNSFPFVNWHYLLSTLVNQELPEETPVLVYFVDYLTKLSELLLVKEPWVVHYGMLTLFIADNLEELVTYDYDEDRKDFCVNVAKETLNEVMSHLYMHYIGRDKINLLKEQVTPITDSVMQATSDVLLEADWLPEADKEFALHKLANMNWQIGGYDRHFDISYIEEIHDDVSLIDQHFFLNAMNVYKKFRLELYALYSQPVDKNELIWGFTAQPYMINAFHLPSTNSIVLPEAFFRPPYFDPNAPFYINLGSAGTAFAHEVSHAFDFVGAFFDEKGVMSRPFSEEFISRLKAKIDCFNSKVEQEFRTVGHVGEFVVDLHINNSASHNENFADIAGLEFAAKALNNFAHNTTEELTLLPGLTYTKEQLFYIGYAQPYCAILPAISKIFLLEIDEHMPHDIRINSVLTNSPTFRKAFQCSSSSKMVFKDICPLY